MPEFLRQVTWQLAVILLVSTGTCSHSNKTVLRIQMPGVSPKKNNAYLCTSVRLPAHDQYIVQFEPKGNQNIAHHMMLLGCDQPFSWKSVWDCDRGGTCANEENIIFAWANGASDKSLPKDVGFQVGKVAGIRHLVLQVHYKLKDLNLRDNSGFLLHITPQRQPYLAGIFLLWANDVDIPPKSKGIHSDIVCKYSQKTTMYAFAFRTHAHGLGRVISGYRVRNDNWTLLGKGDPKEPQAFYPMKHITRISSGDTLAARCTYDTKGHNLKEHVHIGSTGEDEMCNFYIMYYQDANDAEVADKACDNEQEDLESLYFPDNSDTPLERPSSKTSTGSREQTTIRKHTLTNERKPFSSSSNSIRKPTHKITSKPQIYTGYNSEKSRQSPTVVKKLSKSASSGGYQVQQGWPHLSGKKLGQVAGVAVDSKGNIILFHRGSRVWDYKSFDDQNIFIQETPIKEDTVVVLDQNTGEIINQWGRNMFYMPHGIAVDHHDNIWLTDVATHQVYKFSSSGADKPLQTFGEKFVPDSDESHFCQPSDVAIERSGSFFVADGYCNNRIVKFNAKGDYLGEWGTYGKKLGEFNLPHSLSLDESRNRLYIADRQNGRVQVLSTTKGVFLPAIKKQQFGYVFAVDFNQQSGLLHVVNGNPSNARNKLFKGCTVRGDSLVGTWPNDSKHFHNPHDVASSSDNKHLYVVEIGPNKIWKLTNHNARSHHDQLNVPGICRLPMATGPCRAALSRWFYDSKLQACTRFIYGGCSGNRNNFKSVRECETKCGHYELTNVTKDSSGRSSEKLLYKLDDTHKNSSHVNKPVKQTDDWLNAAGEDEGIESNIYASSHYNQSTNHTTPRHTKKDQSEDEEESMTGMIPALVILSVLAVPIVFLLLISIALRIRAYRRDSRYKSNRLLKTDQDGLAVGRTLGWISYLNCCSKRNYRFDKVNLAEFYSDSESDGV